MTDEPRPADGHGSWNPWERPAQHDPPQGDRTHPQPPDAERAETQEVRLGETGAIPDRGAPSAAGAHPAYVTSGGSATPAAPGAQGGYPAGTTAYASTVPFPGGTDAGTRKAGPGWGTVLAVCLVASLLAALGGGAVGAWLVSSKDTPSDTTTRANAPTPQPGPGATSRAQGSVASIAAKATPSVVTIKVSAAGGSGTGSGWVYDDSGHIVTNNHVVADAASGGKITVVLANGKSMPATVVGTDVSYDLAVVKVDRTDLAPLPIGTSAEVVVGDEVIAVGAPLGLDSTVTTGIVSALNRPVTPGEDASSQSFISAIQTDAAINPGNSGGPLLDMAGHVIGVNSAIARVPSAGSTGQSGSIGVGFAIPSDIVRRTVEQLITKGKAEHPVIGVFLDREYTGDGVRIDDAGPNGTPAINAGGPAAKAGLKPGDVITAFEGRPITRPDELIVAIRARGVGDKVSLTIQRGGQTKDVTMVLQGSGG